MNASALLAQCHFPTPPQHVDVAVSGGPDSVGLLLLALEAGLTVTVHHVDHHARATSGDDAAFVRDLCAARNVAFVRHDVQVAPGPNFEERARLARRQAMPRDVLTGHTMDDLVETIVLNLLRGAGAQGQSPMIGSPGKPLLGVRRQDLHAFVAAQGVAARVDESNADPRFTRNRVRHELLPLMDDVMRRDVVPILARQAQITWDEQRWLDDVAAGDTSLTLDTADCRELRQWPVARLRRWLRTVLHATTPEGDVYAPSVDEVERAMAVVRGDVVACELSGGRRLARRDQRLTLGE